MAEIIDINIKQRAERLDAAVSPTVASDGGRPHDPGLEARIERLEAAIRNRDEPMTMTDREIDAKFEAAEARTDTKIARMEGKLDLTLEKIGHLAIDIAAGRTEASANRNLIIGTLIAGLIAVAFGLFAVLQWSDARMFGIIQLRETMKPPVASSPATSATANPPSAPPEQSKQQGQ